MSGGVDRLVEVLDGGGVALMPTDTLPGLHARIDAAEAVEHIKALKGRDGDKPLLVLAASVDVARLWSGPLPDRVVELMAGCWPGPFTLILPAAAQVPPTVSGGLPTLAVRVPASAELREALSRLPVPVVSTSANRAGEPSAGTMAEAVAVFGDEVDLVAEVPWEPPADEPAAPSTLVDATCWPPRVLRQGAGLMPDVENGS